MQKKTTLQQSVLHSWERRGRRMKDVGNLSAINKLPMKAVGTAVPKKKQLHPQEGNSEGFSVCHRLHLNS